MSKPKRICFTSDAQFTVSAAVADKPITLTGYAIVWNKLSTDRGGYKVRFKPYSANIMASSLALFNHNYQGVLGNTENGTLRSSVDDTGVKVEIDLPNTSVGRDVAELVGKKYMNGMSFGMMTDPAPECEGIIENDQAILEFSKFYFDEVTVTAIPAFIDTSVEVKPDEEEAAPAYTAAQDRVRLDRLRLSMTNL